MVNTFLNILRSVEKSESTDGPAEGACNACFQISKGKITTFMSSERFLEKFPERIEGKGFGTMIKNSFSWIKDF